MAQATDASGAAGTHHKAPNYYLIWLYLAVITLAEVGVAFITGISKELLIVVLLFMAVWKAVLVALYYMHLKFEPKRLWWIALSPVPLILIFVGIVLLERW